MHGSPRVTGLRLPTTKQRWNHRMHVVGGAVELIWTYVFYCDGTVESGGRANGRNHIRKPNETSRWLMMGARLAIVWLSIWFEPELVRGVLNLLCWYLLLDDGHRSRPGKCWPNWVGSWLVERRWSWNGAAGVRSLKFILNSERTDCICLTNMGIESFISMCKIGLKLSIWSSDFRLFHKYRKSWKDIKINICNFQ